MKFKELQKKAALDIDKDLARIKMDLMKLRAQASTGSAGKDAGKIREYKRTIARINTLKQRDAAKKPKAKATSKTEASRKQ